MTENAGLPRPARLRGMILIDPVLYISIALAPSVGGLVLYQRTSRLRLTGGSAPRTRSAPRPSGCGLTPRGGWSSCRAGGWMPSLTP